MVKKQALAYQEEPVVPLGQFVPATKNAQPLSPSPAHNNAASWIETVGEMQVVKVSTSLSSSLNDNL